jgi:hypothetical protein
MIVLATVLVSLKTQPSLPTHATNTAPKRDTDKCGIEITQHQTPGIPVFDRVANGTGYVTTIDDTGNAHTQPDDPKAKDENVNGNTNVIANDMRKP